MLSLLRRSIVIFIIGFIALFVLRISYGYVSQPNGEPLTRYAGNTISNASWKFASGLRNYASAKLKQSRSVPVGGTIGGSSDQKYEKIANIGLRSNKFDTHETDIRDHIKTNSALIQFEQRQGLKGNRLLRLAIGVNPDKFDQFVEKAQTFGTLTQLTINKSDKTNEYRDLQAKRGSLEKSRKALDELKKREGDIRSMVELEKQILSLEQKIQALGVNLGDFDSENEFVTVKLLLAEAKSAVLRNISFIKRALTAFVWTVGYYTMLWLALAFCAVAILASAHVIRMALVLFRDADKGGAKT